jgi:hypothetical protein
MHDSIELAHVADAIERAGGDNRAFGYDEAAGMAAEMLDRFAHVREAAAAYAAGATDRRDLDNAVLDALAGF